MLGALSLVVSSQVAASVKDAGDLTGEDAAVIVLLGVESMTITAIADATQVTHSGAVRMVDRLERAGLVRRGRGEDGRTVVVSLTAAGVAQRDRVLAARADLLDSLLTSITAAERAVLAELLRKILRAAISTPAAAVRACRLCDEESCVPLGCPVEDRYQEMLDDGDSN
ncbi:MarR family winged helix-turn-helix transcriptional regulator [Nocardia sp. NPDC050406]|uniref:MarR family winged helix-turn-helix transcriptional regulator n=1 Tax=Nocardia sp. NPDC050406 TaxID=3364318 RepID=UPI0037942623